MNTQFYISNKYLFDAVPDAKDNYFWLVLAFFSFLVIFGVVVRMINFADLEIRSRQAICFITVGVMGLIYVFSRKYGLPWLASRAYLLLVGLIFVGWLIYLVFWMRRFLREQAMLNKKKEKFDKYLPKAKR